MTIVNFSGGYRTTRTDAGSGAGSRGGHVIGKTSSGKPIYASFNHPKHANFTAPDHREAAKKHKGLMERPSLTSDFRGRVKDAIHHEHYEDHTWAAKKLEAAKDKT